MATTVNEVYCDQLNEGCPALRRATRLRDECEEKDRQRFGALIEGVHEEIKSVTDETRRESRSEFLRVYDLLGKINDRMWYIMLGVAGMLATAVGALIMAALHVIK